MVFVYTKANSNNCSQLCCLPKLLQRHCSAFIIILSPPRDFGSEPPPVSEKLM